MERPCRVVAALLLLASFNLRLGICSYDAHQGTANHREEDVHSAARAILREALRQPSRYRSQQHFGSKQAGWRNLGAYPPPAYRSWYTGGSFQGSSFPPPPPSSSSSSPNPYRTPSQQPSFPRWPPWPWRPNLPPTTTMNFPPLQGSGGSPTGAPAPAPAPVVTKPLASPRHAEDPAHSGVASPPKPATVVTVTHGTAVVAGEASSEAKRAPRRRPLYVIAAAGASVLLAMSVALSILCYRSSKVVTVVRPWATGLSGQLQKAFVTGVPALKRTELELACEDFSNVVGSLSDYMMYKGTLSSGVEIAVISTTKSAKEWSKHSEAQFRKKITSLSRVNHKNFVNLLGYCEQEQPFTRMMVFEYAPNGTLFEHLHEREDGHLDWPTRLRVAVGVAYCLEHMHQLSPPEILRALDTSTIYLTDDFAAKIADVFFCCDEEATATTSTETASQRSPVLSDRESVVYSYGMVLLEIMSGRFTASEGSLLEGWAASFLRGERRLRDVMDPGLSRNATLHGETVERLDGVIRSCTDREARRRPAMPEVARRLREITAMPPDAATPKVSPLWWAELEIISTEAT